MWWWNVGITVGSLGGTLETLVISMRHVYHINIISAGPGPYLFMGDVWHMKSNLGKQNYGCGSIWVCSILFNELKLPIASKIWFCACIMNRLHQFVVSLPFCTSKAISFRKPGGWFFSSLFKSQSSGGYSLKGVNCCWFDWWKIWNNEFGDGLG